MFFLLKTCGILLFSLLNDFHSLKRLATPKKVSILIVLWNMVLVQVIYLQLLQKMWRLQWKQLGKHFLGTKAKTGPPLLVLIVPSICVLLLLRYNLFCCFADMFCHWRLASLLILESFYVLQFA